MIPPLPPTPPPRARSHSATPLHSRHPYCTARLTVGRISLFGDQEQLAARSRREMSSASHRAGGVAAVARRPTPSCPAILFCVPTCPLSNSSHAAPRLALTPLRAHSISQPAHVSLRSTQRDANYPKV